MRLFIAIFPPKHVLDELRDVMRKFAKQKRNLKPIPIDQLHITVKFIGANVSESSFEIVKDEFLNFENNINKFSIKIKNIRFGFERDTNPKFLLAKIEKNNDLTDLGNEFHNMLKELRLRDTIRWKRRYSEEFHITLAKLKNTATKSTGKQVKNIALNLGNMEFNEFIVNEVYLMQSSSATDGTPVYKKLEKINLT